MPTVIRKPIRQRAGTMALIAVALTLNVTVSRGADQLELVPLPPAGPGTVFQFGDGGGEVVAAVPAGDVDGDGLDDLFTVVHHGDFPWVGATVFLIFGQVSPSETLLIRDPSPNVTRIRLAEHVLLRPGVAPAGDIDDDGFDDFLISTAAYSMEEGDWHSHHVHLIFGSPRLRGTEFLLLPGESRAVTWRSPTRIGGTGLGAGGGVSIGDFNGDGTPEFAFAAFRHNDYNGRVYIASLLPNLPATEMDLEELGVSLPGFILEGVSVGDEATAYFGGDMAGHWIEAAGDLNGDGLDDLYVGYARAQAHVVFGSRDFPARLRLDELGERGVRLLGPPSGSTVQEFSMFSNAVFPGDLDGDGYDDFVVGSWIRTSERFGRVHVVWGRPQFPRTLDLTDAEDSQVLVLTQARDEFCISSGGFGFDIACFDADGAGQPLAAPGDIDLDGYPEILVGAPKASRFDRMYSGMAYLIYGGPELRTGPAVRPLPEISGDLRASVMVGPYSCDRLGEQALAGVGDFDGDGVPDLAIGTSPSEICEGWDANYSPQWPRLYLVSGSALGRNHSFLRGDCNDDGKVDLSDAVCTLNWLFLGGPAPGCLAVTNTNGDAAVDLSDPVSLLNHLFLGGPAPEQPFPDCGLSNMAVDSELGCGTPPASCQ